MVIILAVLVFFLLQILILFCCAAAGNDPASQFVSDEEQMDFIREWVEQRKRRQTGN